MCFPNCLFPYNYDAIYIQQYESQLIGGGDGSGSIHPKGSIYDRNGLVGLPIYTAPVWLIESRKKYDSPNDCFHIAWAILWKLPRLSQSFRKVKSIGALIVVMFKGQNKLKTKI